MRLYLLSLLTVISCGKIHRNAQSEADLQNIKISLGDTYFDLKRTQDWIKVTLCESTPRSEIPVCEPIGRLSFDQTIAILKQKFSVDPDLQKFSLAGLEEHLKGISDPNNEFSDDPESKVKREKEITRVKENLVKFKRINKLEKALASDDKHATISEKIDSDTFKIFYETILIGDMKLPIGSRTAEIKDDKDKTLIARYIGRAPWKEAKGSVKDGLNCKDFLGETWRLPTEEESVRLMKTAIKPLLASSPDSSLKMQALDCYGKVTQTKSWLRSPSKPDTTSTLLTARSFCTNAEAGLFAYTADVTYLISSIDSSDGSSSVSTSESKSYYNTIDPEVSETSPSHLGTSSDRYWSVSSYLTFVANSKNPLPVVCVSEKKTEAEK